MWPWWRSLGAICLGGLVVRIGYTLAFQHPFSLTGDPSQYHYGANLLVDGKGFIDAFYYRVLGQVRQTALHAPLYTVALAVPSLAGLRSVLDHQLWSCVIGTGTIAVVALVARRVAGPRAGLIAAGITAAYPNAWILDGILGVETLTLLTNALVLLAAYRLWFLCSIRCGLELGVACGLAALTRGEALLFLPLVIVPTTLSLRGLAPTRRFRLAGAAGLAAVVVLAPWVGFNLARFNQPLLVSRFDVAMAPANCDDTWYGPGIGYWSAACFPDLPAPRGDESDDAAIYRREVVDYVSSHLERLPTVVVARLGRTFGFYRPAAQIALEGYVEGRDPTVAAYGLGTYYLLVLASIPGAIALRRRQVPLWPLLGMVATAAVAVAATYGQTRFRASAELVPVVLAAVGIDALLRRQPPAALHRHVQAMITSDASTRKSPSAQGEWGTGVVKSSKRVPTALGPCAVIPTLVASFKLPSMIVRATCAPRMTSMVSSLRRTPTAALSSGERPA